MTRIASTPFYADGPVIATWGGWGVLGSSVPATGTDGPALAYPTLAPLLPGAAGSEVRIELLTFPASGTFTWYDDTSASLVGASNGAWTSSFRVFIGEVDRGLATAYFYVGGAVATLNGSLGSITGDLLAGSPRAEASLNGTLGSIGGNLLVGTFSFGRPRRTLELNPGLRTIGGKTLGDGQA
jgi:hypothetical protein